MSKKAKTLFEMWNSLVRLFGQSAADDWVACNLSDKEIKMLNDAIQASYTV